MEKQAVENILNTLPPGPWHARGNTVFAGSDVVAVVFARHASFTANQIAKTPERLESLFEAVGAEDSKLAELEEKLEALEEKNDDLKIELETANMEIRELRAELAAANNALDDRLAGK